MGNEKSKGSVVVTLEKSDYTPGEQVSGLVYLYLTRRIRTDVLLLKIKCTETSQWKTSLGRRVPVAKAYLLRQKYPLFNWPTKEVPPGSYAFPFHITLPNNLPGSFRIEKPDFVGAIQYKIKAEINGKKSHITHHVPMFVRQVMSAGRAESSEVTHPLGSSWCREKGVVRLRTKCGKTWYTPEETVEIQVDVDNGNGGVSVVEVRGYFFQTLKLQNSSNTKTHLSKSLLRTSSSLISVPPHTRVIDHSLLLDLSDMKDKFSTAASTHGKLIECAYSLETEIVLDPQVKCIGPVQRSVLPIGIYTVHKPDLVLPEAPVNWQPMVMPPSMLRVSPEFEYQPSAPPMEDEEITIVVT